jgi:predicted PurR-regulated permease PerM
MNDRLLRQRAFFFGMIAILAILSLILLWQFIKPILTAVALVIILKPLYTSILRRRGINNNQRRATAVTMIIFILIIAIPAILIIGVAVSQAARLINVLDIEGIDLTIGGLIAALQKGLQGVINLNLDELRFGETIGVVVSRISDWAKIVLLNFGQSLPRILINTMVVLVIIYVFLPRYNSPEKQEMLDIIPFPAEITQLFLDKIDIMIKAMFRGTFVIAIAQGLAMGLVLFIAGVPFVVFFTLLSMLLSLVPLIGSSLIAWPAGIILILTGHVWQGIFVIAAFILFIANIDTMLRPVLIPKGAQLNQALVILSVFGGLSLMGIIGALYGPVIMILLVTSLDVYTKYLLRSDLEALEKQGRIDLKQLGLVAEEDEADQNLGKMIVTVLKNLSTPFRRDTGNSVEDDQVVDTFPGDKL